jgi:cell division septal protein FtsQ
VRGAAGPNSGRRGRRPGLLALVTAARILGALLMLAAAAAGSWAITSTTFALTDIDGGGNLRYSNLQQMLEAAGLPPNSRINVFRLRSGVIRAALLAHPQVADADARVVLPGRLVVSVTERVPVLAVQRAEDWFLVDGVGQVLASVGATEADSLALPTVHDERQTLAPDVTVGSSLDPIDLAAMLTLGAITPSRVDARATSLDLRIEDDNGYVLSGVPAGWTAIFGNYTPTLRPTDIIPRQVQCLRSLLAASEGEVGTIYLAPLDERCGTFMPLESPGASPRTRPSPSPSA